jgi:hypothetical protein
MLSTLKIYLTVNKKHFTLVGPCVFYQDHDFGGRGKLKLLFIKTSVNTFEHILEVNNSAMQLTNSSPLFLNYVFHQSLL